MRCQRAVAGGELENQAQSSASKRCCFSTALVVTSASLLGASALLVVTRKLVVTSASLLGASALLVVTRSYLLHFWVGLNPTRPAKDVCSALGQVRWALRTTIPVGQTWLRGLKSLQ